MRHYTTLHYLHYTRLNYTPLHCTNAPLHYTSLHYTQCTTLRQLQLQLGFFTLHYARLHYAALHYTTLPNTLQVLSMCKEPTSSKWKSRIGQNDPNLQLGRVMVEPTRWNDCGNTLQALSTHHKYNCNYAWLIALQHNENSTILQLQLQLPYSTPKLWVRWPLQPLQPFQKTPLQPPFGPSVGFALPSVIHNNQPLL